MSDPSGRIVRRTVTSGRSLIAWALLAHPDAPVQFRRGLVAILADEQRHLGLYFERLAALGM